MTDRFQTTEDTRLIRVKHWILFVDTESSGTALKEQDTSSRSGNDAHADDADIRPIYDEEPMAEVQTTAEINIFATGQQHTEQPEFNNEGEVDQNAEQCHDTCPLPAQLTDNHTTELSNQSLEFENIRKLFKTVGLKWIPTRKIFTSSTTKVDSEPTNGSNADITNQYESAQTLDVSAAMTSVHNSSGLAPPRQMTSDHNSSELRIHDHSNEPSSSKLVPKVVPPADKTATSRQELELLFHHHITMLRQPVHQMEIGDASIPAESDSLPHLIAHSKRNSISHQDSRIMKLKN
ncbi:hypothetical protein Tco_1274412 [Tanacetum coccineum]